MDLTFRWDYCWYCCLVILSTFWQVSVASAQIPIQSIPTGISQPIYIQTVHCDSIRAYESAWSYFLQAEDGRRYRYFETYKNVQLFHLPPGNYTFQLNQPYHGIDYHLPIRVQGGGTDTIKVCKEYFIEKIKNDPTPVFADQMAVGDTFCFQVNYGGCAGPLYLDSIQLVRTTQEQFTGHFIAWTYSGERTRTEWPLIVDAMDFSAFGLLEKNCRLLKNSGSSSASPSVYLFSIGDNIRHFVDKRSNQPTGYWQLRQKLLASTDHLKIIDHD